MDFIVFMFGNDEVVLLWLSLDICSYCGAFPATLGPLGLNPSINLYSILGLVHNGRSHKKFGQ